MMVRDRWIRTAIGAVVTLKLLGLAPFLATLSGGDRAAIAEDSVETKTEHGDGHGVPRDAAGVSGVLPTAILDTERRGIGELLEAIHRRSAEIDAREVELSRREGAIAGAAKDLEEKIATLEALSAKLAPDGGAGGDSPVASMEQLSKIYGTMKAEEAAPLLDRLENETVHAIFRGMKQRQISAILPLMDPDKAVELTELLGGRQRRGGRSSPRGS